MTASEKFANMAGFYENMKTMMAAICVRKGGIPSESYVGRFFVADVLEMLINLGTSEPVLANSEQLKKYQEEFKTMKDLVTPSQKPIHEMTLEEFEKVMNI